MHVLDRLVVFDTFGAPGRTRPGHHRFAARLLDRSGNIVGIVVAKFDAMRFAEITKDMAQNVNFANANLLGSVLGAPMPGSQGGDAQAGDGFDRLSPGQQARSMSSTLV